MPLRVKFFPGLSGFVNPYWPMLKTALEAQSAVFDQSEDSSFRTKWLVDNRGKVDVLHFHYIQQFYVYESARARPEWVLRFARNLIIARVLGYRTVFTLHNLKPTNPLKPNWVDFVGHWAAANLTNSVIVHCENARRALAARYGRRRNVHTVFHPNYIGAYPNVTTREEARARLNLDFNQLVFAFLGGVRPNKGIERLVSSFRQITGDNYRLLIAGDPGLSSDYGERIRQLASEDDRIRTYLQYVADDEIQVYLNAADAVVLPFRSIQTSGSAILAMSFGKPVIAPILGCLPELIDSQAGILYEPRDEASLTAALESANKLNLREMGRAARQKVEQYSSDEAARRTLRAYLS